MITAGTQPSQTALRQPSPAWRKSTLLLVGLSLSIGWGIRGNFGHEYGAAFAGCLAAFTVCLLSGRPDWRERVFYVAFLGAIGWGFGGSISYMQVISFTESGHLPSQWFGYTGLFLIGFLWAALGGAGTALAAVADRPQLEALFRPLVFVFAAWVIQDFVEDRIAGALQHGLGFDATWSRHKSPLYWFDADYLAALFALAGVCLYDLMQRKEANTLWLPVFGLAGAVGGWLLQRGLDAAGLLKPLTTALTYPLGDPSYLDPATGKPAFAPDNFLNNWPQWFGDYPEAVGIVLGLLAGCTLYFLRFGKFRHGASLVVHLAVGWFLCFLAFPVLGSLFFTEIGGLRMTPPRGDDWAGILGVFLGLLRWLHKNNYRAVMLAAVVSGTIGGLGFSGMQWVKQLAMAPGNPRILVADGRTSALDQEIISRWANWQHQNWHSFLEQTYGFVNGLAIAVALGLLATRLPLHPTSPSASEAPPKGRWTTAFAVFSVLLALPYVNLVKNVKEWSSQLDPAVWKRIVSGATEPLPALWDMPLVGRLPGVTGLHLTPEGWYTLSWLLLAGAFVAVVRRHWREPLAFVPKTALGKGQLALLMLLWVMVIGNFERALVGWTPGRLLTEWVIFANAVLLTVLLLVYASEKDPTLPISTETDFSALYRKAWLRAAGAVLLSAVLFLFTNRLIYRYPDYAKLDKKTYHTRFGPEASWRAKPNLKNAPHK
ncbi:hypothetical protein [Tellurirhabdus rosea]|uniref:hypothetical protein n=1 Tax=Tellurirhabdus rosea TaxID=2674997 RepID=UPI002252B8B3|nr:hypothetical protein [Tellurirhabdus rosea]